jgi:Meiotically Up-regulated Gene 113 (MUG113) protein
MIDHVYFMLDIEEWEIKIGRAVDVERRLHNIRASRKTGEIVLLGVITYEGVDGKASNQKPSMAELAIHQQFAADRIENTEWFRATGALFDYIKRHRDKPLWEGEVLRSDLEERFRKYVPSFVDRVLVTVQAIPGNDREALVRIRKVKTE